MCFSNSKLRAIPFPFSPTILFIFVFLGIAQLQPCKTWMLRKRPQTPADAPRLAATSPVVDGLDYHRRHQIFLLAHFGRPVYVQGGSGKKPDGKRGGGGGVRTRKTCFAFPFFFFLPLPSPNNPNLPPKKRGSRKTCNARVSTMCRRGGWTWSVSSLAAPGAKDSGRKRCLNLWVFYLQRVPYLSAGSVRQPRL